jgi:hypothetical protein
MQTYHYDDESHKVTADNAAETLRVSDATILAGNPFALSFEHLRACEQHLLLHEVPRGALSAEPAARVCKQKRMIGKCDRNKNEKMAGKWLNLILRGHAMSG